jgi:hypothetical protein
MEAHLSILEARPLPKMDVIETSGPHCKVVIRGQPRKEQTATVKK